MRSRAPVALTLLALAACPGADRGSAAAPTPEEIAELGALGRELFFGRAGCDECHKVGDEGSKIRGPDLGAGEEFSEPVAARARSRRPELIPIVYMVESILDPDAVVVDGYAAGVMKRPDEPPIDLRDAEVVALAVYLAGIGGETVSGEDLAAARESVRRVRREREERAQRDWADELIGRIGWDAGEVARGEALFSKLGCGQCHDSPANPEVQAPTLRGVGARLSRENLVRWIVAPPKGRMPAYDLYLKAPDLADLAAYLMARE